MTSGDELLLHGEIVITHRLVDASNATLFGEIADFGPVIYKPIAGERPLWDFTSGTLADREVAAYKVSLFLGWDLVPSTVLRAGPFGEGIVQKWIEVDESVDVIEVAQSKRDEIRRLAFFDALINNTDRKFGHVLVTKEGEIFGCDHGVTFHDQDKLRTVIWQFAGEPLISDEIDTLSVLDNDQEQLSALLSQHLIDVEIEAFFMRARRLRQEGRFPEPPTDWPAIPWPPV